MMFYFFSNIFIFITITLTIRWSFPFILSSLFGMKFFHVCDPKLTKFLKKLNPMSSVTSEQYPEEWIIGETYIGYIKKKRSGNGDKRELFIFTFTQNNFLSKKLKKFTMLLNTKKRITHIPNN